MSLLSGYRKMAKGEADFNIIGKAGMWFIISGIVMVLSVGALFIRHLNLGLAFRGGSQFSVEVADGTPVPTVPQVQDAMKAAGVPSTEVQLATRGAKHQIRVTAGSVNEIVRGKVIASLAKIAGQKSSDDVSVTNVGPTWGAQISSKALRALIVFLILVVIYISFRFEPKMALAAGVALIHDVVITVGIYALVGFEVNPETVIAYLTILGYSLYDSVVVFDKVRENQAMLSGTSRITYSAMTNKSVNQTIMRSINTSLSSLLPVGALLFVGVYLFGAQTLKDLALALFIGITVGSYSSIFVGPPLLSILKEREPRYRQLASRVRQLGAQSAAMATAGATAGTVGAGAAGDGGAMTAAARSAAAQRAAIQARARKKRGGKRRR